MKKVLMMTALVVLFALPAMAAIKTTRHNLGSTGDFGYRDTINSQICIFCHTPHNATQNVPLWNRSNPTGAFTTYSGLSATINNTIPSNLATDSISRFCMSCHDSVTGSGLGSRVVNTAGLTLSVTGGNLGGDLAGKASIGGAAKNDLSNDHPVGFQIIDGRDADIQGVATITNAASQLKLYKSGGSSNFLECATCHDPHGKTGVTKFLRKTNDSSSLCLTCHIK